MPHRLMRSRASFTLLIEVGLEHPAWVVPDDPAVALVSLNGGAARFCRQQGRTRDQNNGVDSFDPDFALAGQA